jgi:transglutaminase-like putative cysteine protease
MRRMILFAALAVLTAGASAQQTYYEAANIPKELLPYASSVIREYDTHVEVKDLDNVVTHVKQAITVLNKNGEDAAHLALFYDKSIKIGSIKGLVYNEFGKQIDKFNESKFSDQSAVHDFSLFEDTRVKHYIPAVTQYPYTVVYEYDIRAKQSLNLDDWRPSPSTSTAVEKSSFTINCMPGFNIRYKEMNLQSPASINGDSKSGKNYSWQISNLKARRSEPYSPNQESYIPQLRIAPEKFEYEGLTGSFTNWKELGKWEYDKLLANRQYLPDATVAHIKSITANVTDPKEKAKIIYEYMQGKTHYISVQIGIGGYRPFLASEVDNLNYGDCKGLVNYTRSLLNVVGIESYYCVVKSGDRKISMLPDFASMDQGDHIILCLPFKNDTTWLECTSQKIPFGYLGDFTDDRLVLACTPEGGKLLHTPKYTFDKNIQNRVGEFTIKPDGTIAGSMTTTYKGLQYETREGILGETKTERNKMIQKVYGINNLIVNDLEYKQDKLLQPVTTEKLSFEARDFAVVGNNKLQFSLDPVDRSSIPREVRNRANNVYINDGFTDEDELVYTVPAGYKLKRIPLFVNIEKPFGKYTATAVMNNGKLIYKRKLQIIDGTYDKAMYDDLVEFYTQVSEKDRLDAELVKEN